MTSKRGPGGFIKADPDAKRVKQEGGAGNISLMSIPMAPTSAASASSSAVVPKIDVKDRKIVDVVAVPTNGDRPRMSQKKKRYYVGSIKARRGSDWVSAHFIKRDMTVAFTVYRQWPSTWESEGVEREIIQRLKKAKFDVVPVENWGFIDRHISQTFRNGMSNTLSSSSSSGVPKHLDFTFRVKVQESGQNGLGANVDAKENVRPDQHASARVEPKTETPVVKGEENEKTAWIPRK